MASPGKGKDTLQEGTGAPREQVKVAWQGTPPTM